mgnify:FL=1
MEGILMLIVSTISKLGYFGIFIGMMIESSFIPFPSEIIMIPAGYLVQKGEMNMGLVILFGILGSIAGALINYYISKKIGKALILKYGKYFFISGKTIEKSEQFFLKHGEISTFTGRLIPGIRQLISIPAGMFGMNLKYFVLLTALGSGIWLTILAYLGFIIGENEELLIQYMPFIKAGAFSSVGSLNQGHPLVHTL